MRKIDISEELKCLAEALANVSSKGAIDAFCVVACGDDELDELAYWKAIRLGAQRYDFWVIGNSSKIETLDKPNGYVTKWISSSDLLPTGHVIKIYSAPMQ